MCRPGHVVPSNTHFDTTRANIEFTGARAVDLPLPEAADTQARLDFKGNMDVAALERLIADRRRGEDSAHHAHRDQQLRRRPAGLDGEYRGGARAWPRGTAFRSIWTPAASPKTPGSSAQREPGYADFTPKQIAQKMFSLADGCTFSAKKDAFANIGGFLCTNDDRLAAQETNLLILTEGFPTYGGLAGRDLEAIAVGLEEVLDPDYLRYRIASTGYLGRHIADHGVPIVEPPGGHAIYIDAARMLPHIPRAQFPAQALAVELYRHAGIRSVEIGSVMFGENAQHELLRLAIPRRVYTQSHIDYVVEAILEVNERREQHPRPGDRGRAAVSASL